MRFTPQQSSTAASGAYIGRVTRVVDDVAYVEIPQLADGFEWPAQYAHDVTPVAGWSVAVVFLNDSDEELLVVLRLS